MRFRDTSVTVLLCKATVSLCKATVSLCKVTVQRLSCFLHLTQGGGRYDKLLESFGGDALPACGFGCAPPPPPTPLLSY